MIPVYEAYDIREAISEKVGHTRPWKVIVNTPNGLETYIVKLYTTNQIETLDCVTSEIICNKLSSQFELISPDFAFIDIREEHTWNLPPAMQQQFIDADPRLKFATKEIISNSYITGLSKSFVAKRISIDTLYAFDNLIRNADRGQQKPNLQLTDKYAFLIDHEFALKNQDIANINLNNLVLEDRFTKFHLFYQFLHKSHKNTKNQYFNEFDEYLRFLNLNPLTPIFTQLHNIGYAPNVQNINNWLNTVKNNSAIFVNSLKSSIQ